MRRATQDLLIGVVFSALSGLVLRSLALSGPSAPPPEPPPVASSWPAFPALREHPEKVASYAIDARLDTDKHRVTAHESITFLNASNAPLTELWFHLYLNAFKNDKSLFLRSPFGAGRSGDKAHAYGYVDVKKLSIVGSKGDDLWAQRDHHSPGDPDDETDLRVPLPEPLAPGATLTLALDFEAQLPEVIERMGYEGSFHFLGQWFPKLAKLEPDGHFAHFAFHAQSEFYADFGDYDVKLEVPDGFVVGATGVLTAQAHVKGRQQLAYHASDVHDFAWTAWDHFQMRRERIAGTDVTVLYPPHHERNAETELSSVRFALPHFNRLYGAYPYPTLTLVHPPEAAANAGGMEYPTLITTGGPWYSTLTGAREIEVVTVHELGHQWFYGLLASNEHTEPFLDEGFNSYAEADVLESHFGAGAVFRGFGLSASSSAINRVISAARGGDEPVAQGAADFASFRSMGALVYSRTAIVLGTLERVEGRARFQHALGNYTRGQRFEHPSWPSFESALTELDPQTVVAATGALRERGTVDYLVRDISNAPSTAAAGVFDGPNGREERKPEAPGPATKFASRAVIFRHGSLELPVDIELGFEDGSKQMRRWDGVGATFKVESVGLSRLISVEIDPDQHILLDDDRSNNWVTTKGPEAPRTLSLLLFAAQAALGAFGP